MIDFIIGKIADINNEMDNLPAKFCYSKEEETFLITSKKSYGDTNFYIHELPLSDHNERYLDRKIDEAVKAHYELQKKLKNYIDIAITVILSIDILAALLSRNVGIIMLILTMPAALVLRHFANLLYKDANRNKKILDNIDRIEVEYSDLNYATDTDLELLNNVGLDRCNLFGLSDGFKKKILKKG